MDDVHTETSADAPRVAEGVGEPTRPAHLPRRAASQLGDARPRRRWLLPMALTPVVLLLVLVIAWAVDTRSGEVSRNVRLAGVEIGGLSEDELAGRVGEVAEDFGTTPVELAVGDTTYQTTAGEIGLLVDKERTAASALEVGEATFFPLRPFSWARSLFSEHQAPLHVQVDAELVASTVVVVEGDDRVPPTEPTVDLVDGAFNVVPGVEGMGIDPAEVARRLPGAAEAAVAEGAGVIRLDLSTGPIPPLGSEDEAQQAAAEAETLVSEPIEIQTAGGARSISSDQLRSWVRLTSTPDGEGGGAGRGVHRRFHPVRSGEVGVTLDEAAVADGLRRAFADVEGHPVDASFTLEGGVPVIRPDQPGLVCCGEGAAATILASLESGNRTITLQLIEGPASFTSADAEAYGIKEPVGGNNAWRSGAPTTAEPGFTTYHDAGGNRVSNIHRIADLVRGVVVAPGATFSINDFVGERTPEKGFLPAGAISNGEHVDEVGGGISQFATTTFNALYFAGLQIDSSQAHSEYFSRYPRGREATMGFPAPDLVFTNNTPYGIMIWTSYTDSSLTVTLYSTAHARGEQTGITESTSGNCRIVTTTRTVTFPDGTTENDTFKATYRPGAGRGC